MAQSVSVPDLAEPFNFPRFKEKLDVAIRRARNALLSQQSSEGSWCFELEADCTIPAEYILMMHYMGEIDEGLQAKLANYLRSHQADHGGWPLFYGGEFDMSCSVKTYYALKLAGDSPDDSHMVKARQATLDRGGAARCNVFTRITLALFGQIPWRGVPFTPVEVMLFPRWFLFHFSKISYWSRTVMVPVSVLCSLKPKAGNPQNVHIRELFTVPPELERNYFPIRSRLNRAFLLLDKVGRFLEPCIALALRRRALRRAETWFTERLNGRGGLGAIFPAMVNAYEALACLGYPKDHPHRLLAAEALKDLLVVGQESAYCQPCTSAIWDTGLSCLTLLEEGSMIGRKQALRALDWLTKMQLIDEPGDWRLDHPSLEGGGWPFQFSNPHYPDLDDTAVVAWAMRVSGEERYRDVIRRAVNWILGMQSKNGGFAAFDSDNCRYHLNEIPFADHGALLDPPTSDVTARCATLLAGIQDHGRELDRSLQYLMQEQEKDGSWFGRWGTNYIYGTWSVLAALEKAGADPREPYIRRAVNWLKERQRSDGGWGEGCETYFEPTRAGTGQASTSFQTAWAMLGLMAAGEDDSPEVHAGAEYLLATQQPDGLWEDDWFTAPGFPRVFYLKYHGYRKYFPLWALARYRNLRNVRRG